MNKNKHILYSSDIFGFSAAADWLTPLSQWVTLYEKLSFSCHSKSKRGKPLRSIVTHKHCIWPSYQPCTNMTKNVMTVNTEDKQHAKCKRTHTCICTQPVLLFYPEIKCCAWEVNQLENRLPLFCNDMLGLSEYVREDSKPWENS